MFRTVSDSSFCFSIRFPINRFLRRRSGFKEAISTLFRRPVYVWTHLTLLYTIMKTTRDAVKISAEGGIIGVVSTAGVSWKYSRSLHGTALSLGAGAVFGWTFGQEVATTGFSYIGWTLWLLRSNSWNGGRTKLRANSCVSYPSSREV